jgi:hypothetical protein
MDFKINFYSILALFTGWVMSEFSWWIHFRREIAIENRQRVWEKEKNI